MFFESRNSPFRRVVNRVIGHFDAAALQSYANVFKTSDGDFIISVDIDTIEMAGQVQHIAVSDDALPYFAVSAYGGVFFVYFSVAFSAAQDFVFHIAIFLNTLFISSCDMPM